MNGELDFKHMAQELLNRSETLVEEWLPDGKRSGAEYTAINPTRSDAKRGSFKVNIYTGVWSDFATGDAGNDLISLYAYLNGLSQKESYTTLSETEKILEYTINTDYVKKNNSSNEEWLIMPLPGNEPDGKHFKLGMPTNRYKYSNFYIFRYMLEDGSKEIRPMTYRMNVNSGIKEWKWLGVPENRSIFRGEFIKDIPILIVEGEKAASVHVDGFTVVSWAGGSNAIDKTDWKILDGRTDVHFWADRDEAGRKTVKKIKKKLPLIKILKIDFSVGDGQDIADIEKEDIDKILKKHLKKDKPIIHQYFFDHIGDRYYYMNKPYKKNAFAQLYKSMISGTSEVPWENIPVIGMVYDPHKPKYFEQNGINHANKYEKTSVIPLEGEWRRIDKLLRHLTGNDLMYGLFLNWIGYFAQTLHKSTVAFVFLGDQGAGKGILMKVLGEIFGDNNCMIGGNEQLESRFNGWLEETLLVNFNEVSTPTYNARQNVKDRLKTLITEETFILEKKGVDSRVSKNRANFIISSNEQLPLDIENGDRRYNVCKTGGNLVNEGWFDYSLLMKEVPYFLHYINNMIVSYSDYNKVIFDDIKKELVSLSENDIESAVKAIMNNDKGYFEDSGVNTKHSNSEDGWNEVKELLDRTMEENKISRRLFARAYHQINPHSKLTATMVIRKANGYMRKYKAVSKQILFAKNSDLNGITYEKTRGWGWEK